MKPAKRHNFDPYVTKCHSYHISARVRFLKKCIRAAEGLSKIDVIISCMVEDKDLKFVLHELI
jgi:hypothetical protein